VKVEGGMEGDVYGINKFIIFFYDTLIVYTEEIFSVVGHIKKLITSH